jgi:hypothetical protein
MQRHWVFDYNDILLNLLHSSVNQLTEYKSFPGIEKVYKRTVGPIQLNFVLSLALRPLKGRWV